MSPKTIAIGMTAIHATDDLAYEARLKSLQERFLEVLGTEDAREGLAAFLEKRAPVWKGR
jgi:enoyl-CoA hydratase/carnithine racemase